MDDIFLKNMVKKNLNNKLEEILSKKDISEEVKNTLLSIFYKIENGYLLISFNKRLYFIYDEESKKNIEQKEDINMDFTFRIDNNESISNKDFVFKFKA